ncbi:MAG: helix-turn-helix domain-containing protein [Gemmatimonadales bacterium]|nr:helix-turn-helix domain-containing protein [Gemmatimonadales bacterium]
MVLSRLDQVRALADPLRVRLVETLVAREASVAELAAVAEVPLTRLYHHVDLLLETGLIEVVSRIRRRGAEERRFRAVAARYTLAGSLLEMTPGPDGGAAEMLALGKGILGGALEALTDGLAAGRIVPGRPGLGLILQDRTVRMSAAAFQALAEELPAWLDEFSRRHRTPRGAPYRVVIASFPASDPPPHRRPTRNSSKKKADR